MYNQMQYLGVSQNSTLPCAIFSPESTVSYTGNPSVLRNLYPQLGETPNSRLALEYAINFSTKEVLGVPHLMALWVRDGSFPPY